MQHRSARRVAGRDDVDSTVPIDIADPHHLDPWQTSEAEAEREASAAVAEVDLEAIEHAVGGMIDVEEGEQRVGVAISVDVRGRDVAKLPRMTLDRNDGRAIED